MSYGGRRGSGGSRRPFGTRLARRIGAQFEAGLLRRGSLLAIPYSYRDDRTARRLARALV